MNRIGSKVIGGLILCMATLWTIPSGATSLEFVGTQYDVGGTFFPGYSFPKQCCFVPWRSDSSGNVFSTINASPYRYYGTAGWALFGTMFEFPDANTTDFNIDYKLVGDPLLPNLEDLPSFVAGSQILAHHKGGADAAALIDDPRLQAGIRWWTFDGSDYPPPTGQNTTGSVPYVKAGYLHGWDEYGHDPTTGPAGRWAFTVGDTPPKHFRVGVMTDGLSDRNRAPGEVFLFSTTRQFPDTSGEGTLGEILDVVSTGEIPYDPVGGPTEIGTNRFIDMHFFDIVDAQPGDSFFVAAQTYPGQVYAGINGISFDVLPGDGDYNDNGVVDAADYVLWRHTLGQTVTPGTAADGDGLGTIDNRDRVVWRSQFGNLVAGSGSGSETVPEPSSGLLILTAAAGCLLSRSAWRQQTQF